MKHQFALGIGAVAAGLLMFGAPTHATIITVNGNTIVSDTYEGDPLGAAPVADVGSWVPGYRPTPGQVSNAVSPGPAPGSSRYLEVGHAGAESISANVTLAAGDALKFESMVNLQTQASTLNFPWQMWLSKDVGGSYLLFHFYSLASGSWTSDAGSFTPPANLTYGTWQKWTLDYVVGAPTASLTIDGSTVSFGASNTALDGSAYNLTWFTNGVGGAGSGRTIYLDDVVVPEPTALAVAGIGALSLLRRRMD